MKHFFYPGSICIVGASTRQKSIGYELLKSIKNYEYKGRVFPVNPKADHILEYNCYHSISDIDYPIDLAIVVVPKKLVMDSIDALVEKDVKSVILITAGFRETGQEGKQLEEEILEKIKKNDMRLVGPNCMGVINTLEKVRLNATFVAEKPERGGIGFLSQSGALGAAVLNSLRETDIKFAQFISIGNKADVSEHDILKFWIGDANIKTIAFYLESFERGYDLIRIYKRQKEKKPLIILKSGRTSSGMKAASSHTGALSTNDKLTSALLEQFGIIRVNTIGEMFNTAKGFENFPIPQGDKIAVVTNAGGPAILTVDRLEERELTLGEFSDYTKEKLKSIVHPEGNINNPVDLLPAATTDLYKRVNQIILNDDNIDAVISIFVEPVMVDAFEVIESVNSVITSKPLYQVCMPLPEFWQNYSLYSKSGKPVFRNPEDPVDVISNILHFENRKNENYDLSNSEGIIEDHWANTSFMDQESVTKLCRKYKIPLIEGKLFDINELRNSKNIDFPIVIKGISDKVIHKTDFNAVKLDIKNVSELNSSIEEVEKSFHENNIPLEQVLVQPFVEMKYELLLGGFRDPSFGPIVMFGTGGKYVEILNDTRIKSAYMNNKDVDEIINKTKIGKILNGVRGEKGIEILRLKRIIKAVSKLMLENQSIMEIDINPLTVNVNNELIAVDVRIKDKNG